MEMSRAPAQTPCRFAIPDIVYHMVNNEGIAGLSPEALDALFLALSDPTRRAMIGRLSEGPASIGELGEPYAITKPAVTKHVKVLERAGLVRRERRGRVHRLTLRAGPLRDAESWIEFHRRFWESSLDSLVTFAEAAERSAAEPSNGESQ